MARLWAARAQNTRCAQYTLRAWRAAGEAMADQGTLNSQIYTLAPAAHHYIPEIKRKKPYVKISVKNNKRIIRGLQSRNKQLLFKLYCSYAILSC